MSFVKHAIIGAVASLMLSMPPLLAQERLTVVADEWPPFSGESLPGMGISIDVTRAVLTRAGFEVDTAILPWSRVVSGARAGDYDVVTSLFLDDEMQKALTYSEPFFRTEVKFVRKKGAAITYDGLQSLAPYTIAVGTGFLYEPEFDRAEFLTKFEVTTTLQGVQMVAAGRVDLTLDSTHVVTHSILEEDPELLAQIEFLDPSLANQEIHMAVSKRRPDHEQIVASFNAALSEMRADGSLAVLLQKHAVD
ncbi:substrate-binding periplasmic protein [Roseobacter sinensis]|uniref:Transporter substrate-binding domain-containing protein n=1 Tax=Roseobacter sinensis TaxID=2931391 RepID=A0ABT3BEX0_9RHOB|nr:transporter substrate-binding domain-containing protein [Roseobacter sp. WL0113]MCV3272125.1 transporter substrate-binding domain-containing protein [Roseobacter sp. WL0113]